MDGTSTVLYQGHASFRLSSPAGRAIFIDPYAGDGYDLEADAVFCSHAHRDHSCVELVRLKPAGQVWLQRQMYMDDAYAEVQVGDVTVRAVPAYNEKHPRETTVGFLVGLGGKTLYFAGDTSKIPEMEALSGENIAYAFFPTDGFFNMDAEEASACAEIVGAAHSVPIHTCRNTGGIFNEENALRFQAAGRVILRPGDRLEW